MNDITWTLLGFVLLATTLPLAAGLLSGRLLRSTAVLDHGAVLAGLVLALVLPAIGVSRFFVVQPEATAAQPVLVTAPERVENATENGPNESASAFMRADEEKAGLASQLPPFIAYAGLLGLAIMFLRLAFSCALGLRLLRRAEPLADGALYAHLKAARQGGGPLPVLFATPEVRCPAIWCWGLRPSLLIPEAAGERDGELWRSVFEHELAHVRRRDNVWTLFAEFALCFLYWHPLAHVARRHLHELADLACDDHAAAQLDDRTAYADALVAFAVQPRSVTALSLVSDANTLQRRVQRLLEEDPMSARLRPATAASAVALLAISLAGPLAALPEGDPGTPFPNNEGNVIKNSGFEDGEKAPEHWSQRNEVVGVTREWLREGGIRGSAFIRFTKTEKRYFPIAAWNQQADVPVPDGATHVEVAGYVRCEELTKAVIDVEFENADGKWSHGWAVYLGAKSSSDPPLTHDWKRYTGTVQLPPNTKSVTLSLQQYGPGQVDFDEVGLRFQTAKSAEDAAE